MKQSIKNIPTTLQVSNLCKKQQSYVIAEKLSAHAQTCQTNIHDGIERLTDDDPPVPCSIKSIKNTPHSVL